MNKEKLYLAIMIILAVALISFFILPYFKQKYADKGKMDLINEMIEQRYIPIGYTYCPDVDWKLMWENLENNQQLRQQAETQGLNFTTVIDNLINNQKALCKEEKLILAKQPNTEYCNDYCIDLINQLAQQNL